MSMSRATAEQQRIRSEYGRIVSQVEPHLIHKALSLTRDHDRARDLVQATLERGLRSFARFQVGTNAVSWLSTIMTHHFIDEFRRMKLIGYGPSIDTIEIPNPGPEETPPWADLEPEEIQKATAGLPDYCRVPFELRAFGCLSYREIAARLDLSINTVGSRIHRARQQLRQTLLEPAAN